MQPAAQVPRTHRRHGAVIHRIQRVFFSPTERAVNFQVAARCSVENHRVGLRLLFDPSDVRQVTALRVFDIGQ